MALFSRSPETPTKFAGEIGAFLPHFGELDKDKSDTAAVWGQGGSPHARVYPAATAVANFAKKSSAIFLAAPAIRRWPSWASLPPICASTL